MEEYVLSTSNLVKKYKNKLIVDNVNMNIKRGEIYGLIGENGAGKTSIIRLITGLYKANDGEVLLFGDDINNENNRKRIGALIESPSLHLDMTAHQNLEAVRIQRGIPGKECIEKSLKLVNLNNIEKKKVKNFSLGMKQKLAIAIALLDEPEFLILDEPINGLDPTSIIEIRNLLKKLNREKGITILISSHILKELHKLATCYGIVSKGKLIEEITSEELEDRCKVNLEIKVDDVDKAVVLIEEKLKTSNYKVTKGNLIKLYDYINESDKVIKTLVLNDISVYSISPVGEDLEDYYINLIGGKDNV